MDIDKILKENYSTKFDEIRKNLIIQSTYKYGQARKNFPHKVNALESMQLCVNKYIETGNKEYLCDAANYLSFEFMYPKHTKTHFKYTNSEESAGVVGFTVG